jgi:hypothetical protein
MLDGFEKTIDIDKIMLNYKYKSHRGRSFLNWTDAICKVEVDDVTKAL